MSEVNARSICKRSYSGFHNWYAIRHDSRWQNYECICSLCHATSHMHAMTFTGLKGQRDKWWASEVKRRQRRWQTSFLKGNTAPDVRPEGGAG